MIEPNCDMPWDIYLDWLQDQGNEDLRDLYGLLFSISSIGVDLNFNHDRGDSYLHSANNSIGQWLMNNGGDGDSELDEFSGDGYEVHYGDLVKGC